MTNQPTDQPPGLTLDQAAVALGISREAVRLRLRRGTLEGIHNEHGWCVYLPTGRLVDPPTQPNRATNRPTDQADPRQRRRRSPARDREIMRLEETIAVLRSDVEFLQRLAEHQAGQLADLSQRLSERSVIAAPVTTDRPTDRTTHPSQPLWRVLLRRWLRVFTGP